MARSSSRRSSSPPPRRQAAPSRNPPAKQQAQPPAVQQQQPKQPGMFAQMATTAAGVAVGSAVGHTLGAGLTGMFGGGGSSQPPVEQQQQQQTFQQPQFNACDADKSAFMRCLDQNSTDMNSCQFYLDMLNQCKEQHKTFN